MYRPPTAAVVPFVSMPYVTAEGRGGPPQPGFFGGWLGRSYDPLFMLRDPNAADFRLPELSLTAETNPERLTSRKELIRHLAGEGGAKRLDRALQDMDEFQTKAFDLLTSPATQKAFQLDQEPPKVREAYGRNIYGQSVLLARRLIEAGTRVVSIAWAPDSHSLAALACLEREWSAREADGLGQIPAGRPRVIQLNGQERLLDDRLSDAGLAWSPDSSKIAAAYDYDVKLYDAAGEKPGRSVMPASRARIFGAISCGSPITAISRAR